MSPWGDDDGGLGPLGMASCGDRVYSRVILVIIRVFMEFHWRSQ